jgi:dsRNA-specific ribonuclease
MKSGRKLWLCLDRRQYSSFTKGPGRRVPSSGFLANFVRTRSERLVCWLQNREPQHYGPKSRIPELFHRRDLRFLALLRGQFRIKALPPKYHHNLLDAAATVASLEMRLGYTFKDRLTCIEALKTTGEFTPLYCDGTVYKVDRNNRLALLGDRVLSLVVCEMWFQTGHSTKEYNEMSVATVSRWALADAGRSIGLSKAMLTTSGMPPGRNPIAETFEAILGAIYVDSNYSVDTVKAIIKKLNLGDHQFLKTREQLKAEEEVQMAANVATQQTTTSDDPILETSHQPSQELVPQPFGNTAKVHEAQVPDFIADEYASKTIVLPESYSEPDAFVPKILDPSQYELETKRLLDIAEAGSPAKKEAALKILDTCSELRKQGDLTSPVDMYRELRQQMGAEHDKLYRDILEAVTQEQARAKKLDEQIQGHSKVKETKAARKAREAEEHRLRDEEVARRLREAEAARSAEKEEAARRQKEEKAARRAKEEEEAHRAKEEAACTAEGEKTADITEEQPSLDSVGNHRRADARALRRATAAREKAARREEKKVAKAEKKKVAKLEKEKAVEVEKDMVVEADQEMVVEAWKNATKAEKKATKAKEKKENAIVAEHDVVGVKADADDTLLTGDEYIWKAGEEEKDANRRASETDLRDGSVADKNLHKAAV